MGACHTFYDELRFDVTDPHLTHVYVYIRCQGDCPHFIQGWHHKAFPATKTTHEIWNLLWGVQSSERDDPVMWAKQAPPSEERNRTLDEAVKYVTDEAALLAMYNPGDPMVESVWGIARKLESMKTP